MKSRITIRLSHVLSEASPKGRTALKFKELVQNRLGERVRVEIYPNGELYDDENVVRAVLLNNIQIALPAFGLLRDYTNKLEIFELPFLFNDINAVSAFERTRKGRQLLTSVEAAGLIGLGWLHNGFKQLGGPKPFRRPSDLLDVRLRIHPSSVAFAFYDSFGAAALLAPLQRTKGLLSRHIVEAQENTWSNIWDQGFYIHQHFITATNHSFLGYILLTSEAFWLKLPKDIRMTLQALLNEAITFGNFIVEQDNQMSRTLIEASGSTTIIDLTPQEREAWIAAVRPLWPNLATLEDATLRAARGK